MSMPRNTNQPSPTGTKPKTRNSEPQSMGMPSKSAKNKVIRTGPLPMGKTPEVRPC